MQGAPAKGERVDIGAVVEKKLRDLIPHEADGHVERTRSFASVQQGPLVLAEEAKEQPGILAGFRVHVSSQAHEFTDRLGASLKDGVL